MLPLSEGAAVTSVMRLNVMVHNNVPSLFVSCLLRIYFSQIKPGYICNLYHTVANYTIVAALRMVGRYLAEILNAFRTFSIIFCLNYRSKF
jgi:hypothetical protein